ncbi:MAG: ATP-binding protein [Thermoplasmata archaeon]|nr:ATP-binding protein [Thermoplasmata archaeon]
MVFYIVIRGPLGVGKSTVSQGLSRKVGAKVISIDQILDDQALWVEGRLSEFLKANAFAVEAARPMLAGGTPVIFEGNFYWKSQIQDLVGRLAYRHRVFTLGAPVEVCVERDRQRNRPHGPEAARAVFVKSTKFDYGTVLDATGSVDSVVRAMVSLLASDRFIARG